MADKGSRKLTMFQLRKELELQSTSELLADILLYASDAELWELLRSILIAMRVRTTSLKEAKDLESLEPLLKSYDLLYTFSRFIEMNHRFPNKKEQQQILSKDGIPSMRDLLRKKNRSARERRLKEKDFRASTKGSIGIPDEQFNSTEE